MRRVNPLSILLVLAAACSVTIARLAHGQKPHRIEVSGLPALNFDADEGFGYGVILALYSYDAQSLSYRWTAQPTVFMTTQGRRDYTLFFDSPSSAQRPWRTTAFIGHEQQLAAPYYGIGNASPFDSSLEHGSTRYFYRYGKTRDRAALDVQHSLGHQAIRGLFGAGLAVDVIDLTPFDSGSTLIGRDLHDVTPPKTHTNFLRAGLTWDTRDREIGTQSGTWADVLYQVVDVNLGASTSYTRWTATGRHYQPIGQRLTLANRLLVQDVNGNAPFFVLSDIQTTQKTQDGLGGASTVRGIPKNRYVGKGVAISNNELRWRATQFTVRGRESSLVFSGFFDAGRVWTDGIDASTLVSDLHTGYGVGTRLGLGNSFVVAVDVGHSRESAAPIYIGLGYMF